MISPTHTFAETGIYTIAVEIISPIGCRTDTVFQDLIEVSPSPGADFIYSPLELTQFNSTVQFTDQSNGATGWFWNIGSGFSTSVQHPEFTFPDTGLQEVQLIVSNEFGCRDTVLQLIDVLPEVRYFMPNAFTPNGDGNNDVFKGKGVLEGVTQFKMMIWNRWGEQIFSTLDPKTGWDGRRKQDGRLAPAGVYVYLVSFTGPRGQKFEYQGFATLIK